MRQFFFPCNSLLPFCYGVCNGSKDTAYFIWLVAFMKLTFITCITSRGPIISGSYLMCALLVARATEQYKTPLVFMRVDSILCTQEADAIPPTCKIKIPCRYRNQRLIYHMKWEKKVCLWPSRATYCLWLGSEAVGRSSLDQSPTAEAWRRTQRFKLCWTSAVSSCWELEH